MTPDERHESSDESSTRLEIPENLIRGADGALYLISNEDLAPYKLPPELAKPLTEILKYFHTNPESVQLTRAIVEQLKGRGRCVNVQNTFINDVPDTD